MEIILVSSGLVGLVVVALLFYALWVISSRLFDIEAKIHRSNDLLMSLNEHLVKFITRTGLAQPPVTPPPPAQYFRWMGGLKSGPYSVKEMVQFRSEGRIDDDTQILRDGETEWRPLRQFPEII